MKKNQFKSSKYNSNLSGDSVWYKLDTWIHTWVQESGYIKINNDVAGSGRCQLISMNCMRLLSTTIKRRKSKFIFEIWTLMKKVRKLSEENPLLFYRDQIRKLRVSISVTSPLMIQRLPLSRGLASLPLSPLSLSHLYHSNPNPKFGKPDNAFPARLGFFPWREKRSSGKT